MTDLQVSVTPPCYQGKRPAAQEAMDLQVPRLHDYMSGKRFISGDSPVWLDFYFFELL